MSCFIKKNNIYIYIENFIDNNVCKIIIIKNKLLLNINDEDYFEFLLIKIKKLLEDKNNLINYLMFNKLFNDSLKIKIYNRKNKEIFKNTFLEKNIILKCYDNFYKIDLVKLKENNKFYKKFINRCFYYKECKNIIYTDQWFKWFLDNNEQYFTDINILNDKSLVIYCNYKFDCSYEIKDPIINYSFEIK